MIYETTNQFLKAPHDEWAFKKYKYTTYSSLAKLHIIV